MPEGPDRSDDNEADWYWMAEEAVAWIESWKNNELDNDDFEGWAMVKFNMDVDQCYRFTSWMMADNMITTYSRDGEVWVTTDFDRPTEYKAEEEERRKMDEQDLEAINEEDESEEENTEEKSGK